MDDTPAPIPHARAYARGMHLGTHAHREAQLLFAASGIMQVTSPAGRWLVPPARAVWLPPRFEHAVDMLADIEMRTLYFAPGWLACHDEAPRLGRAFVVQVAPLLRHLILGLFTPGGRMRQELMARLALFELAPAEAPATFLPLPTDPRARRVAERILADPARAPEIEVLAREAGASARTITRLFPAGTELTYKTWRQRARIMAAMTALAAGREPIKTVAARFGFASAASFAHAFRQVAGMPPSALAQLSTGATARNV